MSYDNSPDVLMLMILCFAVQGKYQKILLKSIKVVYLTNGTNGSDCSHVFCIVEYLNFSRRKFTFINLCILKGSVTIKYVFKMLNIKEGRTIFSKCVKGTEYDIILKYWKVRVLIVKWLIVSLTCSQVYSLDFCYQYLTWLS